MTRDQIEELAALDALSALEGEDLATWERVRGENPSALRLRDDLADAAAQLCLLARAAIPPSALRQRVMDRVFGGQPSDKTVTEAVPDPQNLQIVLQGYGDYAKAKAHVLWDSGQRGWYVQAGGLPLLPATHSYHVWAVDGDGVVHACGALAVREGGLARSFVKPGDNMSSMQGFAVTIEPVGSSSPAPTSPAVLISALQG